MRKFNEHQLALNVISLKEPFSLTSEFKKSSNYSKIGFIYQFGCEHSISTMQQVGYMFGVIVLN